MRKKTIKNNPDNYRKTPQVERIYGNGKTPIRQSKTVTTNKKTKTVDYGPINRTGKQVKTKTITKKK